MFNLHNLEAPRCHPQKVLDPVPVSTMCGGWSLDFHYIYDCYATISQIP